MFDSNNTNIQNSNNSATVSLSKELTKVVFSQLLLLKSQITKDNIDNKLVEIKNLCNKSPIEIQIKLIHHLIGLSSGNCESTDNSSIVFILLKDQIENIIDRYNSEYIYNCFAGPISADNLLQINSFVDTYELALIDRLIILFSLVSKDKTLKINSDHLLPKLFEFFDKADRIELPDNKLAFFLQLSISAGAFGLYQVVLLFSKVAQSRDFVIGSNLFIVFSNFVNYLQSMSPQETFGLINTMELGPSEMLGSFLGFQLPEKLTDAVVFLLTEIIAPTSQTLNRTKPTALTSPDLVEATIKGSGMKQLFNRLSINWTDVIDQLVDVSLQDSYKITVASLSQFLASIPTAKTQDYFFTKLTSTSLSLLQEQVIVALHELNENTNQGGVNIIKLNLTRVSNNLVNIRNSILYFMNIVKLEIRAVANLQKQSKQVSNALSYYFHEDFANSPDYLAIGAASLLEDDTLEKEDPNIAQIMESLIIPLLDINSTFLRTVFPKLLKYNLTKLAQMCNTYIESKGISLINKIVKFVPTEYIEPFLNHITTPENTLLFALSAGKNGWTNVAQFYSQKIKSYDEVNASKFIESFLSIISAEIDYSLDPTYAERLSLPLLYDLMTLFDNEELSGFIVRFKVLESYNELQVKFLQAFPRLSNYGFGHDEAILQAEEESRSFPPDIELKMKNYFEQMYSRHFEIKEITDLLLKLKISDSPQDQDLFACMLHSIIDEYRFYPTYPTEAIALTSVLFGSLVFFRLFEGTTLKIALRYILDSARMPPDSNMFKFAVQALFASRARLTEYKSYCALLASIDNLKSHRALYNDIVAIAEGTYTGTTASTPSLPKATTVEPKEITSSLSSLYIDSNIPGNVEQSSPSDELSESISFFINNLSESNFANTVTELKKNVTDNYFGFFANVLVVQRAKLEPNYHELYFQIVKSFDSKLFDEHLLSQTLTQIIGILNNDDPSDTERQHLKNLGTWLGLITLKRNKPIKNKNMLVESLLIESYDSDKLAIVLPFVCKVIAASKDSIIFKYPNPWTLGVLEVLKELYEFGKLSLNLKFEIEVLCNLLRVNLEDIELANVIRSHSLNAPLELRAAINNGKNKAKQALFNPPNQLPEQSQFSLQQQLVPLSSAFDVSTAFENIASQSHNPIFTHSEKIKNLCQFALTRAIKETLPAIVERINAIAIHSARNLVLKDFALDPDESKLFNAAHQLLTSLIESLTPVQCRDSLKQNILMVLRATLEEFAAVEENLILAVDEIIPIGVELIKTTALKGASADLEKILTSNYMTRRSYRGSPQQFVDVSAASRYAIGLPEPLGLKAGGVTAQQYSVYANFGRQSMAISRNNQMLQRQIQQQRGSNGFEEQFEEQSSTNFNGGVMPQQAPILEPLQQIQQQQFNQPQILETTLEQTMEKILKATVESPLTSIDEVTDDNPIKLHVAQVLAFCLRTPQKDAALLTLAQLVVQALFTICEKKLTFEVFVSLLECACAFSPSALYDVSHWFVQVYDDRKFNKDVIISLLKSGGLITSTELDTSLSGYILQKNENATRFAIDLLTEIIESDDVPLLRSEFIGIIAALKAVDSPEAERLFVEMNELQNKEMSLEEQFGYIFAQWVKICLHDLLPNAGEARRTFIKQLLDTNILSEKDTFVQFLRMATEISVIAFNKENESKKAKVDFYLTTDAYADLIMEILINIEDDNDFTQRGIILDTALSVLVLYFADDHSRVATFNQRPYFRIISSLLSNFSEYVLNNESYKNFEEKFYLTIADKLIAMQPLAFPGFTFGWITLISHRLFLPFILGLENKAGCTKYVSLLAALLNFQSTYATGAQIPDMLVLVYKGTLRIMLLLLHDFPELLVENHYQLTINIPPSFVQLRNVVLSAFPKDMSFPDPFQPGLKIERIPEITVAPKVSYNPAIDLENASKSLKKNIDNYMRVPSKPLLKNIINALTLSEPKNEGGIGYVKCNFNVKLVNALVLYIGMISVNEKQSTFTTNSDECIFLRDLMLESSIELQYQLFEAITNQLRFPNAHTHWFSCIIIYFFSSSTLWGTERENVQQIITRVLLERTIASRPHPWGLLITFTELLKNSEYAFFDLPFTKSAPEFKVIFGSLLKNIGSSSTTVTTPNV